MSHAATIVEVLRNKLGADRVDDSNLARDIAAGDFFRVTQPPACVVRPQNKDEVETAVRIAAEAGFKVHPRGGGMSFSGGYAPRSAKSITLDLAALNRVLEINKTDMYVVVEAGCTWNTLYEALRSERLRVPAYGTRSGRAATVGGSLSQTGVMLGSSRYGVTTEQVLGLEVVLGTGERVRTGQWSVAPGRPFYRFGGPDLTGPFLGDFGAFGVKTEIALRLIEWPEHVGTASFAFGSFERLHEAESAIQRTGLAAEMIGLDEALQKLTTAGTSLFDDVKTLGKLVRGKGMLKGLRDAATIAAGGKRFLDEVAFSLHVVTEARHAEAIAPALAEINAIAVAAGGKAISDVGAQMIRADPFPHMDQVLGPHGERWVPMPFMVAASSAVDALRSAHLVIEEEQERIDEHNIAIGMLVGSYAPALMNLDFMIYWPDAPTALHRATASAKKVAQAERFADNPQARVFLGELWSKLMDATAPYGANYVGIGGPDLRYREAHEPTHFEMLKRIKQAVDPQCTLSPGAFDLS